MPVFSDAMLLRSSVRLPPEFVGATGGRLLNSITPLSLAKPSGVQAGDLLVALVHHSNGTSPFSATVPSGWTMTLPTPQPSSPLWAVYHKVAGASEPSSYNLGSTSGSASKRGALLAYRNISRLGAVTAITYTSNVESVDSVVFPGMTLEGDGVFLAGFSTSIDAWTVTSPPVSMALRADNSLAPNTGGSTPGLFAYDAMPSVAGSSGSKSIIVNNTTQLTTFGLELLP